MIKVFTFSFLFALAFTLMLKFIMMGIGLKTVLKTNQYRVASEELNIFTIFMNAQLMIKFIEVSIVMCLIFILDIFTGGPIITLLYHTYKIAILNMSLVQLTPSLIVIFSLFVSYIIVLALYLYLSYKTN